MLREQQNVFIEAVMIVRKFDITANRKKTSENFRNALGTRLK